MPTTLHEAVTKYCEEHNTKQPSVKHSSILGHRIMYLIKKAGTFIQIPKVLFPGSEVLVNSYPDEFVPYVEAVITDYYENRQKLFDEIREAEALRIKYLNFDIDDAQSIALEDALKELDTHVHKNFSQKGKAQYKIAYRDVLELIKIGMTFQSKLMPPPLEAKKRTRKRIPVK